MKVWKVYNALKMLHISTITLHLGFLTSMLEICLFLRFLCCSSHHWWCPRPHCWVWCILFKGTKQLMTVSLMWSVHLKVFVWPKNCWSSSKQQQEKQSNPTKVVTYLYPLLGNLKVGNNLSDMSPKQSTFWNVHMVWEDQEKQQRPGHRFANFLKEEEAVSPLKDDNSKSVKTLVCASMRLVTPAVRGLRWCQNTFGQWFWWHSVRAGPRNEK